MRPLHSVKMKNRVLFLDGDPFLNYQIPLYNEWSLNDLASEILRACAVYDRTLNWDGAKFLALGLVADTMEDGDDGEDPIDAD